MRHHKDPPILLAAAALALPSCAAEGEFPSLAMRPAERDRSIEEPVRVQPQVPDDAALRRRLAELDLQAAEGQRAFEAAYGPAERAAAAAGAPESGSWIEAQQALSRLEASREPTMRTLVELDLLGFRHADRPTSEADLAALRETTAAAARIIAGQQQQLDRLRARISPR